MNFKNIILFGAMAFTFLLINACGESSIKEKINQEQEELRNEMFDKMMVIHDSLMHQMDIIMEHKIWVKDELERIQNGLKEVSEQRKRALNEVLKKLEAADDGMMDWMRTQSRRPADSLSQDAFLDIIMKNTQGILSVQKQFIEAFEMADSLREEYSDEGDEQ